MSNMSKCFSCAHKNDYNTKFGYYGCNLSGQECKGYSMFEPKSKPKPTNADRIRSMSDEEFSHFLFGIQCAPASKPKEWLDWLKQEATK